MKLIIKQCNHVDTGLLKDLANYSDVYDWVNALIEQKCLYSPLDLRLWMGGKSLVLIEAGIVKEDVEKLLKRLSRFPKYHRKIPNDDLYIEANIFEKELYICLSYPATDY